MKSKKGKALADSLMDDLLEEDQETEKTRPRAIKKKTSGKRPSSKGFSKAEVRAVDESEELDANTDSVALDEKIHEDESIIEIFDIDEPPRGPKGSPAVSSASPYEDATYRLSESEIYKDTGDMSSAVDDGDNQSPTRTLVSGSEEAKEKSSLESKPSFGRFPGPLPGDPQSRTEAVLAQSENLRIAQQKILELEREVQRLRTDNEQITAAGETFQRKADEALTRADAVEKKLQQKAESYEDEKRVLTESIQSKNREIEDLKAKKAELDMRLSTNIQKIRVRERELENRLELIKMESAALVRNKDEIILDLKRQVDQLTMELENFREKGSDLNKQLENQHEVVRRTVKALRLALSLLEGDEGQANSNKKAG